MHSSASSKSSSAGSWSRIGASSPVVAVRSGVAKPAEDPACPGRHLSKTQVLMDRSNARALLACLSEL
eukprot:2852927-Lingulodinium_polyedra.AAC.1